MWANILANHPDTSEGAETYLAWTEDAGYNTAREITTNIGAERAKKIAVSTDLPEEMLAETTSEDSNEAEEIDAEEYRAETKKAPADEAEAEVIDAEVVEDGSGQEQRKTEQTLNNNGRIYHQQAQTIYNIEHIDVFNG